MANRKKYTVLVPYPKSGGHWSTKGETVELLAVQALALVQAGRLAPVSETAAPAAKKTTEKAE